MIKNCIEYLQWRNKIIPLDHLNIVDKGEPLELSYTESGVSLRTEKILKMKEMGSSVPDVL